MEEGGNNMEVTHESRRENFVPQDVESATRSDMSSGSWRLSVQEFPTLVERRDGGEHGFFTLSSFLHVPRKRSKVADYYEKQERLLEGYTEMETMAENGCMPGSLTEDELQQLAKNERMAIYVSNMANVVLFAAKLYVSIQSRSLAVIASTLDSLLDLLSGFILWFTAHAMRNPNQYRYPIGKNRMQPVGIIVFASVMATLGLQILLESGRQFIAQTEPEKDPQKEKWMIGIMVCVTVVKFMLMVYCRRFKNEIIRAYAQDHFFDVITNSIGLAAAILAIRYYWWIDPTGAVIIALYTMNTWTKTVIENVWALIGRTAPPEFLAKLTYLIWNHHEDIKHIDTRERERELIMEEGGNGMNVSHESRRENFGPQDVESAARSEMSSGSWRLSVHEFPALPERRDREHGFFTLPTLLHAPRKRSKVAEYYKKQERLLEGFTEMETMAENGYMPGNLTEAEMQHLVKRERMAIYISNIANIVLFVAKLYVSIQSRSLAVIASTLDSLLDLLSGFILWFTAHAMRNPNLYSYPIGKNRMQPVGIIVFASVMATLGLQILLESVRQLIAQIALYTINTWTKIVIENVWALIGRTAPPEFLAKLTYLIWNHHEDIKHIDTVRAYTFGSNYFVEVDIVLPQDMLLNKAHNIGESLQVKLEQLPEIERAFVHIDFEYTHKPEHKIAI